VKVRCDISEALRAGRAAERDIRGFLTEMEHDLREAAMEERFTHEYKNQTGHLHNSTEAGLVSDSDNELRIDLEQGEEYASYVVEKGYSDFPDIAERTARKIDRKFAAVGRRAGSR